MHYGSDRNRLRSKDAHDQSAKSLGVNETTTTRFANATATKPDGTGTPVAETRKMMFRWLDRATDHALSQLFAPMELPSWRHLLMPHHATTPDGTLCNVVMNKK